MLGGRIFSFLSLLFNPDIRFSNDIVFPSIAILLEAPLNIRFNQSYKLVISGTVSYATPESMILIIPHCC